MHQTSCTAKLTNVSETTNYSDYRLLRDKLAYVSNTLTDIFSSVEKPAQVAEERIKNEKFSCLKDINKFVFINRTTKIAIQRFQILRKRHHAYNCFLCFVCN